MKNNSQKAVGVLVLLAVCMLHLIIAIITPLTPLTNIHQCRHVVVSDWINSSRGRYHHNDR